MTTYCYHLFGFSAVADFELPELGAADADLEAGLSNEAVRIMLGRVPDTLDGGHKVQDFMEFNRSACTYTVPDVARYLISGGQRIVVEPSAEASMIDVRYYLFGTIIGALLHQRQLLPLHISAVETPHGVIAFTGPSGAGKSTLANEIHRVTGWRLISDDVAVIDPSADITLLHCGIFRQKLWKDTVERAGLQPDRLTRDTTRAEKFHVTTPDLFVSEPRRLRGLVVLDAKDELAWQALGPSHAFAQIMNAIYRPDLAQLFGDVSTIMQNAAQLANAIETFKFTRPWSTDDISRATQYLIARVSAGREIMSPI